MRRAKNGFVVGVALGLFISIVFSLLFADGVYDPVVPNSFMGQWYEANLSEIYIMSIAFVVWGLMGAVYALGTYLFTHQTWTIAKTTAIHLTLMLVIQFPLAILAGWFPLKWQAVVVFILIFLVIYAIVWTIIRRRNKRLIQEINQSLNVHKQERAGK